MEISCSQANSDMLLCGWHNMAKLVEMSITGNQCLLTKKQYDSLLFRGLENYTDFSSYYDDFVKECRRVLHQYFSCIDIFSEKIAVYCPTYFASSLLNDCMIRGRSQHNGGTRYHDYGTAPLALANAADSLFAVKKAVFDNKICTANELVDALWHNYSGYETLRLRLLAIPKYGQDHEEADAFAKQYFDDICDIYESYENRWRGVVKPIIFTFVWAGECASHLGAAADGHFAHTFASQGTTPHSSAMTEGLTAAIISNCRMPMIRFTGGGTSMWDFDESWVNPTVMEYFLTTFLSLGGQMFQGNSSVSPEELRKAQADPDAYKHLIVRVGGFSAHFVDLTRDVQDDIIHRHRHNK
jgi:formate C-acetyltransferase